VQEVAALPSEVGVTPRNSPPLCLVVVRPVLLPRERPLLTFQAFALVGKTFREYDTMKLLSMERTGDGYASGNALWLELLDDPS